MILFSAISGLHTTASYKLYGVARAHLNADAFLSLVGGLASLCGNAAGRLFWGRRSDKRGFKRTFLELAVIQSIAMASYGLLSATRLGFATATVVMLFCMGGNFAMFPAQTFRTFGAGGAGVYSFLFTAFGCAALLGPLLSTALIEIGGQKLVFTVLSLMSAFSFTLCRLFL